MKILYEGKLREIEEIEDDHIHLDDGTTIRNHEIIKLPFIWISKFSEKKKIKKFKKIMKDWEEIINKMIGDK
jgi:hypothetical protein